MIEHSLIFNPSVFPVIYFLSGIIVAVVLCAVYYKYARNVRAPLVNINDLRITKNGPFNTLIDNIPNNVYIKDTASKYIAVNSKFAEQLKFNNPDELIGKSDADIYPFEIAEKYLNEDKQIISGEKTELVREQKSIKDGKEKYSITTKLPIKNKNGKIIGLLGFFSDITDQKLMNNELQSQKEIVDKEKNLLRTLIDSMPDSIYIKDKDGKFLDANPTQIAVTKAGSYENILGKTDFDFYPKDIAEMFSKDDKHILDTGEPVIGKEEIGFDTEGNIRVRSTTKVPFFDEKGDVIGLVGIGRDITQLKETEEKLIEQAQNLQEINVLLEERQEEINQQSDELNEQNKTLEDERTLLRTIIDNIPDFVYIKDTEGHFITANNFLVDTLKVDSLEQLEQMTDFDIFPKEMAEKFFDDDKEVINTKKQKVGIEETGLDADGNVIHVLTTKVPVFNTEGKVTSIVGIGRNITDFKETELKLKEQAEYLKEVNVLLEERQEEIQQQSQELSYQNTILDNERNLLRVLIDNIPESIYIKDTQSRFVTGNKNIMRNLGIDSLEKLEGKTDFDFHPKELAQEFYDDEQQIINSRQPIIDKEEQYLKDNGIVKVNSISKVPYFDDNDRVLGIVGISRNITKLKNFQNQLKKQADDLQEANQLLEERAEEIQKQSEWLAEQNIEVDKERNLLRTLIDNMPDFIYIKDVQSKFITANKRLLSAFHIDSTKMVVGKSDHDLYYDKANANEYYNDEQQIIKTGKPLINKEECVVDEYGKEKIISTTKVPFYDPEGKILGIVGIGRDITKQKNIENRLIEQANSLKEVNSLLEERQEKIQLQAEELNNQAEQLKNTNQKLEQLNTTKNKFFSIIAHDLKNPFQAIFGFSELLMRNFDDFDEKQRMELLTMIKTSSESAYNLLENLLQWARTQTHRIKYNPTHINIHDLIKQNVTLSMANTEKKSIKVNTLFNCSSTVWADFNMINLIIRNLLSNAIKFTSISGNISITCDTNPDNKDECIISITDTGIGISKENIEKLFRIDEYFSTSGTAGETGTGLGLIICKEFIEKNYGKLIVNSTLEVGTTFSFSLPIRQISDAED